ncbi:hypothetical protein BSKO_05237 [Bryopsis sp. KO-2023]|nr:hypothetical protein BSKO_05237 [Bryopsis sp. KO-2023]
MSQQRGNERGDLNAGGGGGGKGLQGEGLDDQAGKRRKMNDGGVQAREGPDKGQEGDGLDAKGKRKRARINRGPPNKFIKAIHMAAKYCDRQAAMAAFRGAKAAGMKLNQDTMNSLLYILVGGDKWSDHARSACEKVLGEPKEAKSLEDGAANEPEGPKKETPEGSAIPGQDDFRTEVFEYMKDGQMLNSEMGFTAQARLAACHGDAEQAFEFLDKMLEQRIPGKLRMFTPALVCYAVLGNIEGALKVEKRIKGENLDLTELEFRLLLEACATSGSYDQFATLLASVGKERTFLEESTVEHIMRYFKSGRADEAFAKGAPHEGKEMWAVKHVDVSPDGYCDLAGGKVAPIDLEEADWGKFLDGVKQIALDREKNNAFSVYLNWLERNGPFDIIVDGANVAMHGQNFEGAFFRFNQIECLMHMLATEFPQRRALVILHVGRLHGGPAKDPKAQQLINSLRSSGQLYSTPVGSNDDWYWLYAAIKAQGNGLVVSNDECRDHSFQLLAPKYFLKWKERHLVRFGIHKDRFKGMMADFRLPAPYTPCTQQLYNGTWMIPCVGGKWLCAKPL